MENVYGLVNEYASEELYIGRSLRGRVMVIVRACVMDFYVQTVHQVCI